MRGCEPLRSVDEVRRALGAFSGRWRLRNRALLAFRIHTGYRISEALSLRRGDLIRDGRFVREITVQRRVMKGSQASRTVPMPDALPAALRPWLDALTELGYVHRRDFVWQSQARGNRAITARQALRTETAAYEAAGFDGRYGTHTARKTFALGMRRRLGDDWQSLSATLGHKRIDTTQAYLEENEAKITRAIRGYDPLGCSA